MKTLRPYQQVACDFIEQELNNYKRPFIYCLPTGVGKSLCLAELAKRFGAVLVLTLSAELCKQDLEEMAEQGVGAKAYSASLGSKQVGSITVATIGSAYKRPEMFRSVEVVVIDECQAVDVSNPNSMFMKLLVEINKYQKEGGGVKIVGLTASPYRQVVKHTMQGRWHHTATLIQPLNRIPCKGGGFLWSSIVEGLTTRQALQEGYLTPVEYYCEPQGGRLEVNSSGADYTEDSLKGWGEGALGRVLEVMVGAERNWHIRSGIVALPLVSHAEALQTLCEGEGVSSIVVSSKTPQKARERAIRAFKEGEIRWLIQCNIANVGFNSPITDCLVWARPCLSLNLWQQAVGRIMRLAEGKGVARVVDLAGTIRVFGRAEDVHLGREGFKTTIEGGRGRISGRSLREFSWANTKRTVKEKDDRIKP